MLLRYRLNRITPGLIVLTVVLFILAPAGAYSSGAPVNVQQTFLDLSHEGVLMGVSAHPDDEDGATLAYYRMKCGITTYSVFLTRGEGGQNEIGPELYQQLGALRTEETRQAARIQETEAVFLNFEDFGYSKTATEAFQRWGGKEETVRRLVYMIRKLRPDVIITNHNTINGHGHHQATAIALIDAFDRAGDSTSFPEQFRDPGITPWQSRKLFFRLFNRTMGNPDVVIPIDEINPARNRSYIDIAIEALNKHRTQGMDRVDLRRWTRNVSLYRLMRENSSYDRDSTTFFSGIDLWSQERNSLLRELHNDVNTLSFSMSHDSVLQKASQTLLRVRQAQRMAHLDAFESRTLGHWRSELEKLGELMGDISLTIRLEDSVLVPGQLISLGMQLHSDSSAIDDVHAQLALPGGWAVRESTMNGGGASPSNVAMEYRVAMDGNVHFTVPKPPFLYGPIDLDQSITLSVSYRANGIPLSLSRSVPIEVAPPQTLNVQTPVVWLSPSTAADGAVFQVEVKNFLSGHASGSIRAILPTGWETSSAVFDISGENKSQQVAVAVRPPESVPPGNYMMRFSTEKFEATGEVHVFDVRVSRNTEIAIVESYDNTLESVANELGVHAVLLGEKFLENLDLMQFGTIIVDIRAYLVRADLIRNNHRLLDYVRRGGNLVVMYQKDSEWKPEYAPFPFELSRKRVTREDAPVEILSPDHPLLNKPNVLGEKDWSDWVQERGVYFPEQVSPEYTQLVATHDPDEPPLSTGYLVARVGRGSYIYTSLVWYRQLKERNAGAFRAFANMISYPSYRN